MTSPVPAEDFHAHGLGLDAVAPDWAPWTREEACSLLRRFPGCGKVGRILFASPRPFSSAALVETDRGGLFLKRHHARVRDAEGLIEEHRFIAHLGRSGLPVVEVLANDQGATATATGDWTCEVHKAAAGTDLYRDAVSWSPFQAASHARSAGAMLARLHLAARDYDAPARPDRPLVSSFRIFASPDPETALRAYVEQRPALKRYLARRGDWLTEILAPARPYFERLRPCFDLLAPLWCHNDLHASNLTWDGEGAAAEARTVLDFGLADRTCALFDLAIAIERNVIEWLQTPPIVHLDHLDALLAGYDAHNPLSSRHLTALAALLPLAHVEFALSETDYFFDLTGSPDNALVAYETYLLGHLAWFDGVDGQALLRRILAFDETHGKIRS